VSRLPAAVRIFYGFVFLACLAPIAGMTWQLAPVIGPLISPDLVFEYDGGLGPNPAESVIHETGKTALFILLAALAITPIRRLTGWNRIQLVRRMVGVWSFVYAVLHLTAYVVLYQLGDLDAILQDVFTRKFIFVGMFTFVILLVLTATSTNGMMRRLGRRWQKLHRLVYVAGIAGLIHFAWGQKADIREPLKWGAVLAVLLAIRVFYYWKKKKAGFRAIQGSPVS
jgi:sulfoxide reductase heme-binding subunit YedZ